MRRFLSTVLFIALTGAIPAMAAEPLKVSQAVALVVALRNLDGHLVIVKQSGADNTVMIPWEFGSGALRLRVASNIAILDLVQKTTEDARQAIIAEVTKRSGQAELKPGTPEFDDFQRQFGQMMDGPAAGTERIARIKASELKLDKNEIPVTVLAALGPILDDDTGGK